MAEYRAIKERQTDLISCREKYPLLDRAGFPDDNAYLTECHEIDIRKERYYEEMRKKIAVWCRGTRGPEVCRRIGDAGIKVERELGMPGLAAYAVALGKSEQNYGLTPCTRDFNCFGMGSTHSRTWKVYASYEEAVRDIARLLKRFGYQRVREEDVWAIAQFYKGVPPFQRWVSLIRSIMGEVI